MKRSALCFMLETLEIYCPLVALTSTMCPNRGRPCSADASDHNHLLSREKQTFGPTRFTTIITRFGKMASLWLFIPDARGKEFLPKILESYGWSTAKRRRNRLSKLSATQRHLSHSSSVFGSGHNSDATGQGWRGRRRCLASLQSTPQSRTAPAYHASSQPAMPRRNHQLRST